MSIKGKLHYNPLIQIHKQSICCTFIHVKNRGFRFKQKTYLISNLNNIYYHDINSSFWNGRIILVVIGRWIGSSFFCIETRKTQCFLIQKKQTIHIPFGKCKIYYFFTFTLFLQCVYLYLLIQISKQFKGKLHIHKQNNIC